ncbi:type IV pilus assembly protein PilW [Candidatus Moduliflexus flocculans]|uniref:Type IV pilus assembly protein PilW n=1 Tax=Candidatus Moduliflexus flocculans TaxID=1499966 RepID=A0A081BQK9_9BACT|nr:type IV pilus assembly protein PilW [Candidatus Moduliflexus flocculans]
MWRSTGSTRGFTLLELLISMAITVGVFAIVATVFLQMRKVSARQEMDVAMIQEARLGVDEMARLIRMVGFNRDVQHGQPAIIEAAPFQFTFNVDWQGDAPLLPGSSIPLYDGINAYLSPNVYFKGPLVGRTGAETIRLTLDSRNDGDVDSDDIGDNPEEQTTQNPDDMALMKEINGKKNVSLTIGALGPYKKSKPGEEKKTNAPPMFQYYMAISPCSVILHGDANCDGELTGDERYFSSITDQNQLRGLRRVRISVTTTSERKDPFDHVTYHDMTISTEVSLRHPDKQGFYVPNPTEYPGCTFSKSDCGCLP